MFPSLGFSNVGLFFFFFFFFSVVLTYVFRLGCHQNSSIGVQSTHWADFKDDMLHSSDNTSVETKHQDALKRTIQVLGKRL